MSKELLSKQEMERAIVRMSHEIIEKNKGIENICLVGIQKGGVYLAERLAQKIGEIEKASIPTGSLDITFYRDDFSIRRQPVVKKTEIPCNINGKKVILVDDVFFTGRSIRAAMDAIIDIGRPALIQLAVLIDRGHRELPIRADYVGKNIPTALNERVEVFFSEEGKEDGVILMTFEEFKDART
jgi:pyrimidine operon attenuation protein/uracil phosphoribosyltransferase